MGKSFTAEGNILIGIFFADCAIKNLRSPGKSVVIKKLMVDSGIEHTWIPKGELGKVSIIVNLYSDY